MKKDLALIGSLLVVVLGLLVFGGGFSSVGFLKSVSNSSTPSAATGSATNAGFVGVSVKSLKVKAKIASTAQTRKIGLANKDSIPVDEGMLFVFDTEGKYSIWMKNMRFPIDIIWIKVLPSGEKKIVDMKESVPPQPKLSDKYLTIYKPHEDAKYILEINAGLARSNDVQVGDTIQFSL